MKLVAALFLALAVIAAALWPAYSEPLRLVAAQFSDSTGAPLAGQALVVEQTKANWDPRAYHFLSNMKTKIPIRFVGVTDPAGFIQFVDLPAGEYDVKLIRPDREPLTIKKFVLDSKYTSITVPVVVDLKIREGVRLEENLSPVLKPALGREP